MSGRYVARKFLGAVITIFAIVILNFVLFRMMPGSPDRVSKNPHLTPEIIAANRARWGLDKPLIPDQLVDYIADTASVGSWIGWIGSRSAIGSSVGWVGSGSEKRKSRLNGGLGWCVDG